MRLLVLSIMLVCSFATGSIAGNCDHSWQTAKDGSVCGDRSADSRPGGN